MGRLQLGFGAVGSTVLSAALSACAALVTVLGAAATASAQGTLASPPPLVTTPQWHTWYDALLAQRLAEAPRARATSVHFAQSGDDVTGNGSQAAPYRTLAKARAVLEQFRPAGGNVALLFRRGDVWREQVGIDSTVPNVTMADYGDANLPKPLFTPFMPVGTPAAWTPVADRPGVYMRSQLPEGLQGAPVVWVKEDDDRGNPYSRQISPAGVQNNPGSFFFDRTAGVLYVRPKNNPATGQPTDPRIDGKDYQIVRRTGPGFVGRGDGTRLENLVAEGWGMAEFSPTQNHGIESRATGTARVVIVACESYYGSSHAMTHYVGGNSGGIATFVDCRAGLCNYNAFGETIFNSFAQNGQGETIFDSCVAAYGTLPSSDWDFRNTRRGQAFYSHTASGTLYFDLLIANNCSSDPGPRGCVQPANLGGTRLFTNLIDARCFIVGEYHPGGPGGVSLPLASSYARINGRYLNQIPLSNDSALVPYHQTGWMINCLVDIDASAYNGQFAMFNESSGRLTTLMLMNNHIRVRTGPNTTFLVDYDTPVLSPAARAMNNIFIKTGPGVARFNYGSGLDSAVGNAFFGFDLSEATGANVRAARNIVLASEPAFGQAPGCGSPLVFAADPWPVGLVSQVDLNGTVGLRRTIGPLEPIGLCVDMNSDGRVDVEDLYAWERSPNDLNGDGQMDAADRAMIERAIRWGESFAPAWGQGRIGPR